MTQTRPLTLSHPTHWWHCVFLCLGLGFLWTAKAQAQPQSPPTFSNNLAGHPSAYLSMHGSDPIAWQTWSPQILTQAKKTNRLILLSSGYYACHWCHVMQQDNYQSSQIAQLINQHFIAVKIDREIHSALDQTLLQTARTIAGHSGWPQHLILSPEGDPFVAFVYQPPEQFQTTLEQSLQAWRTQPETIRQLVQAAKTNPISENIDPKMPELSARTFAKQLVDQTLSQADHLSGGLAVTQKFPRAPLLQTLIDLLEQHRRQPFLESESVESLKAWLVLTLEQMQSQALQDPIHGGFFRYTIDPEWQTPHFEKMLYTQALLAKVYFSAAKLWQRADFTQTAQRTLNYVYQVLVDPETGLAIGSQSALDTQGQDGGVYLWTPEALHTHLTPLVSPQEWQALHQAWSLDAPAPFEHGFLLSPVHDLETPWSVIRTQLSCQRRQAPLDNKFVLGWNGLLLSAYAEAIEAGERPNPLESTQVIRVLEQGARLADTLWHQLDSAKMPAALTRSKDGSITPIGQAALTPQAYVLQGLKDWAHATRNQGRTRLNPQGNHPDWHQAHTQRLRQNHQTEQGWLASQAEGLGLTPAQAVFSSEVMPSPLSALRCQNLTARSQWHLRKAPLRHADTWHQLSCQPHTTPPSS